MVLPPREGFAPGAVGAVGLIVHRLAAATPGAVVFGAPNTSPPFADVAFQPVTRSPWPLGFRLRHQLGLMRVLAAYTPRLIEAHNRPELALAIARRFPDVPVSLFLHNDPQRMHGCAKPAQRAALLHDLARVVAVSDWVARRMVDGVANPVRAPFVLPNCLDLSAVPDPAPPALRQPVILFAGRLVADKGADLFVEACARVLPRLQGWRAEMIGGDRFAPDAPDTPFLRDLRPRAMAAGVVLHGYQPHDAVLAAMARAAIVVVPSRWPEPFGMTALEAMACGAALICSPRGGLPDVVGDAAMLAEPDALDQPLLDLAGDAGRRAALGAAGRARSALFGVPQIAALLNQLRMEIPA